MAQVLTQSFDSEQQGWWLAKVKMTKGDFIVVEYTGFDQSTSNEIVQSDRVRPKNCKLVYIFCDIRFLRYLLVVIMT